MTAKLLGGMIGVVSLSACLKIGASIGAGPPATGSASGASGASSGTGTGGSSGGGSSTGGGSCGPSRVWIGDQCTQASCPGAPLGSACLLPGGGVGACFGATCVAVDLQSDPNNCGIFGLRCAPPTLCLNGDCYSPATGLDPFLVDAGNDTVCTRDGCLLSSCDAGSEGLACELANGEILGICCNGTCNYQDSQNCGGCGLVCPGVCTWGLCGPLATLCDDAQNGWSCVLDGGLGVCCNGGCSDLRDPAHCGACETACPIGAECAGACIVPGTDAVPVYCATDGDCPAGDKCLGGTCSLGCDAQADYNPCYSDDGGGFYSDVCCGSACLDLRSDARNCGLCGLACGAGQVCVNGGCAVLGACENSGPCLLGDGTLGGCCGSICVDLESDPDNCGVCGGSVVVGSSCGAGSPSCVNDSDCRGSRVCLSGECLGFTCDGGASSCALDAGGSLIYGMCCGLACVGPGDPDNCGRCNQVCPTVAPDSGVWFVSGCENSSGQGCPAGSSCLTFSEDFDVLACFRASCGPDSDGMQCAFGPNVFGVCCGGRCADQSKDPDNCGACGVACPSGICAGDVCAWRDLSAPCALSCPAGATCVFDRCISSTCGLPFDDCLAEDGRLGVCCQNGGCAHTLDDAFNCGACGYVCPAGQSCSAGACSGSPACAAAEVGGFCNLDGGVSWVCCAGTGCTDTRSDARNCGVCGNACPARKVCQAGTCG